MRLLRIRTAIAFIGAALAFVALGLGTLRRHQRVETVRPRQLDGGRRGEMLSRSRERADSLPRSGHVVKPPQPPKVTSRLGLVLPRLGEPLEVPVPPFTDQTGKSWAFYPAIGDLDGDGRPDLMIGSRLGQMRFHRGIGTAGHPQFDAPAWFDELCPDGRIPTG
jgi:hypothetical protein